VHIAILIAVLNDLDMLLADIQNAYLKTYVIVGPEFGQGKEGWQIMIVWSAAKQCRLAPLTDVNTSSGQLQGMQRGCGHVDEASS
jgi:hypothetical protein